MVWVKEVINFIFIIRDGTFKTALVNAFNQLARKPA